MLSRLKKTVVYFLTLSLLFNFPFSPLAPSKAVAATSGSYSVDKYFGMAGDTLTFTAGSTNFGVSGSVELVYGYQTGLDLTVESWSNTQIVTTIPMNTSPRMYQVVLHANNSTYDGDYFAVYQADQSVFTGRVVDEENSTTPSYVEATTSNYMTNSYSFTNDNGTFVAGPFNLNETVKLSARPTDLNLGQSVKQSFTALVEGANEVGDIVVKAKTILGSVFDADDITAKSNVSINISKVSGNDYLYGSTDQNGYFKLGNVSDGNYRLSVSSSQPSTTVPPANILFTLTTTNGVQSISATTPSNVLQQDGTLRLNFLEPQILGRVLDPLDQPVTSGNVSINNNAGYYQSYSLDNQGYFRIASLSAATYNLSVSVYNSDFIAPDQFAFTYSSPARYDDQDSPFLIHLLEPQIKGKVQNLAGDNLLNNGSVDLTSVAGLRKMGQRDMDGNFLFAGLADGTYSLNVSLGYNSGLVNPDPISVTITGGNLVSTNPDCIQGDGTLLITALAPTKFIAGTLKYKNDEPVTNANISVYKQNGNGGASATTNENGEFSIGVSAGTWGISVYPRYDVPRTSIDWTYRAMTQNVVVAASDGSYPVGGLNLVVESTDGVVTGHVYLGQTGTVAPQAMSTYVSVSNRSYGDGASVAEDGSFYLRVPAGKYNFTVNSQNYNIPESASRSIAVISGTNNLEDVRLSLKTEYITGTVRDNNGSPLENVNVYAFKKTGQGWANAMTDASGIYSLGVGVGDWQVQASSNPEGGYFYVGAPVTKTVTANETLAEVDFSFQRSTSTVNGRITNSENNPLTLATGYATISNATGTFYNGSMIQNGVFTLKALPGTYKAYISFYNGSRYLNQESTITVLEGAQTLDFEVQVADATIKGSLKNSEDQSILGLWGSINATDKNGTSLWAQVDVNNGAFEIPVVSGRDWYLTAWTNPDSDATDGNRYLYTGGEIEISNIPAGDTTQDIQLATANCIIRGQVLSATGEPVPYAQINTNDSISSLGFNTYDNWTMADADGNYTMRVPAGTYNIGVGSAYELEAAGQMPPVRSRVTVTEGTSPLVKDFQFLVANGRISGSVTLSGEATFARVWAYSNKGRSANTYADYNGNYSLILTDNDTWHIGATTELYESNSRSIYESPEYQVVLGNSEQKVQNIALSTTPKNLNEATSVTFDPTSQKTITLPDGTVIDVPAGAITSAGYVTLTANPKADYIRTATVKPVDLAYDLHVYDSNGSVIPTFNGNISITFKYSDAQLAELGITEDKLSISYWDQTTSSWKTSPNFVVDTGNNTITVTTNHFSEWAIVSSGLSTVVDLGPDVSGYRNVARSFSPTVTDDGSGVISYLWEKVSGPGAVVFGTPAERATTATVGANGTYVLRLTVVDGNDETISDDLTFTVTDEPVVAPPVPQPVYQNVYRFWNKNGTHFYTASEAEKNNIIARWSATYKYEGVACWINVNSTKQMTPLYRLWNSNGTHFYTASLAEAQNAVRRWPTKFKLEGVAYNVTMDAGGTPVYRFYNSNGTHFYTASVAEKNNIIARWPGQYKFEGVAYYLPN